MVLDASNEDANCNTAAWEFNLSRISLTQCISSVLHDTLLYAVYNRNLGTTADPDCSRLKYFNGEVYVSASSTWGQTWGEPVNLTNSKTNDCLSGACACDASATSARYCNDSLRIEYIEDLDAGSFIGTDGASTSQENPVRFLSYPCIDMSAFEILSSAPSEIKYLDNFHAVKNGTATKTLVLTDGGNLDINWTYTTNSGSVLTLAPTSGTLSAGCSPTGSVVLTGHAGGTEGLFHYTLTFHYGTKTLDVPVDFYVFDTWVLPQDVSIRTATAGGARMVVNQAGQAVDDLAEQSFTYFADLKTDYATDASLIMGNSKDNLSWKIFANGQGYPSTANDFGWLYAVTANVVDSTTYDSQHGYTIASGKGTNRDSTVAFDVNWYAPHHADSADFFIGHFDIYKGAKNPSGTVTGLDVAYACDWDVPSDSSSDNKIGYDSVRQMIYLQGMYTDARKQGFAGTAAYREDGTAIPGGFAWGNQQQVYGQRGYIVDSVWKYMEAVSSPHPYNSLWKDSIGDMSIVMVVAKNLTVTPTNHFKFDVVMLAKRAEANPTDGVEALKVAACKSKEFIRSWIYAALPPCPTGNCTSCGDANDDGGVDISDAVFLIAYIFSGGAAPHDCNYTNGMGDANADGGVDISDAVYLIAYIFSGGAAPHCQ